MPYTRRSALRAALALLVAPLALACSDATAPLVGIDDVMYAPALGVDLAASTTLASGLAYRDVQVGTGALAGTGKAVSVRYTGWLANGTEFDDNLDKPQPFVFPIGEVPNSELRRAIPGFELGVAGMRVGGRRQLVIPPALAYGRSGYGSIPGNAVIVFDVELVGVQ